jgi:hypothetical protein
VEVRVALLVPDEGQRLAPAAFQLAEDLDADGLDRLRVEPAAQPVRQPAVLAVQGLTLIARAGKLAAKRVVDAEGVGDRDDAAIMKAGSVAMAVLLDRGWGKPAQTLEVRKKGGLVVVFANDRGTDPLANKSAMRTVQAIPVAVTTLEDEAVAAELVDDLPGEPPR